MISLPRNYCYLVFYVLVVFECVQTFGLSHVREVLAALVKR